MSVTTINNVGTITTAVPLPTFGPTGFIVPASSAILAGVQADINLAFGGSLNPDPRTPQGQLATSESAIIEDCYSQFLLFAQQSDPAYSQGRYQDGIGRIYFIYRFPAQATVVQGVISGRTNVVIPAGTQAQDISGNLYSCTQTGTIAAGGTVTLPFSCNTLGPIQCPGNQLTTPYTTIPGWDSITNTSAGVVGNDVETTTQFELRRQQSVAKNALGTIPAITAAVLSVEGVLDAYITDNATGSPVTTGGVTLLANSLYVCVSGGLASEVAQAIFSTKQPGCAYTGNTTVTVQDSNSGYNQPLPSYQVKFQTATPTTVYVAISATNNSMVPSNALTLVQNAVIAAFNGQDGGSRARIGSTIYASRYYAGVSAAWVGAEVISIFVGLSASPSSNTVLMGISEAPVIQSSDITLTLV